MNNYPPGITEYDIDSQFGPDEETFLDEPFDADDDSGDLPNVDPEELTEDQ